MTEAEFKTPVVSDATSESLKLFKMTKCYNWEIKILSTDIDRLVKLNEEMLKQFGVLEI